MPKKRDLVQKNPEKMLAIQLPTVMKMTGRNQNRYDSSAVTEPFIRLSGILS